MVVNLNDPELVKSSRMVKLMDILYFPISTKNVICCEKWNTKIGFYHLTFDFCDISNICLCRVR